MQHTHKFTSAHPLQKPTHHFYFHYFTQLSFFKTPTLSTHLFPSHHNLNLFCSIPNCCKQHISTTIFYRCSQTSLFPMRLPIFHASTPTQSANQAYCHTAPHDEELHYQFKSRTVPPNTTFTPVGAHNNRVTGRLLTPYPTFTPVGAHNNRLQ